MNWVYCYGFQGHQHVIGGLPINVVNNKYLDKNHPAFGKVVEGMDVVDAMGKVKTSPRNDRPLKEVRIVQAAVLE